jgi:ABC-2 type transport system ATP-binding protein
MSLVVESVIKSYGPQKVLDNISFEAKSGEILGFLGPNGAGKTTTMKIICGYTEADQGTVSVCGLDVKEQALEVKSSIGYLPENNPLYGDMFIKEYLGFIARLHGLSPRKKYIEEMIERTGLSREQHKQIRMLSKGYRQRVGLAQALIHDPDVLILDEPTSGLDPNQLEDIRGLIKEIGQEKTVLFSSHIMQEVQALCDRVIIINKGVLVADDHIDQLDKYIVSGYERILVEFEKSIDPKIFDELPGLVKWKQSDEGKYYIDCESELKMRREVFHLAAKRSLPLIGLQKQDVTVENVFQALTK